MTFKTDWNLNETVMPEDMNNIGEGLNSLSENVEELENNKVDKVKGKDLSSNDYTTQEKNKLSGIETGANNYKHPSSHPATIIEEDETHRFLTDIERDLIKAFDKFIKAGGTINGDVTIQKSLSVANYLLIKAWENYGEGEASFWYNNTDRASQLVSGNVRDIKLIDKFVYHQGRKPTADEIGAMPNGHYGLGTVCIFPTDYDWNNALKNGFYMTVNGKNAPYPTDWCFGIVISHNDKYVTQRVFTFYGNRKWYIRHKFNGTWGDWKEEVVEIGALPLSGGIMTGPLYLNNNVPLSAKTLNGDNWALVQLTNENKVMLGAKLPLILRSDSNPIININNIDHLIYHTGYWPDRLHTRDETGIGFDKMTTGFKRPSNNGISGDLAIHITHPSFKNGAYSRGITFSYGDSLALSTYAFDSNGLNPVYADIYTTEKKPTLAELGAGSVTAECPRVSNLNNITQSGWAAFGLGTANAPCDYGTILTIQFSTTGFSQIAFDVKDGNVYKRFRNNTWSAWRAI